MSKKQKDGQQEKKRSGFICQVKYRNTLPDIPLEPKFLPYPFDTQRFGAYDGPTGLERSYKYELLAEHDLGVNIDLINPDAYQANEHENVAMDPIDERLLEEEQNTEMPELNQWWGQGVQVMKNKASAPTVPPLPPPTSPPSVPVEKPTVTQGNGLNLDQTKFAFIDCQDFKHSSMLANTHHECLH